MLCFVRNAASDANDEEIVEICDWIEKNGLEKTFFPEPQDADGDQ